VSSILLRGGRVIDPANGRDEIADVVLDNGRIAEPGSTAADATVIDATGKWIVPGLIDPHVHLRDPGFPEKETILSGLRAAAAGGFTAVAAMANTFPVNDSPETTRYMLDRSRAAHSARLVPVSAVTRSLGGAELVDFEAMATAGARLFSDDGIPIDDPELLARALVETKRLGFAISLHEEDRELSDEAPVNAGEVSRRLGVHGYPVAAEARRIKRDLAIARASDAPVHIAHLSCAESVRLVREARGIGTRVTCEVTPHHFALDETAFLRWGPNAKMNPPLRNRADVKAIREAILDGTVDMIATDHAPHDPGSKQLAHLVGCFAGPQGMGPLSHREAAFLSRSANGVVGLETAVGLAFGLFHGGVFSATRMVEMMSLNPARLLRLDAGTLSLGAVADVTVLDPSFEWSVDPRRFLSRSRNTPFMGMSLTGKAMLTIVGGEIVYDSRGSSGR